MAIATDYKVGIKREVVNALKSVVGESLPFEELRNRIYVGLEYPMVQARYPAIYITYSEQTIRNAGISHIEYDYTDNPIFPKAIKHWIFTGRINFNVMALNALDRDRVAAVLVNAIAFGEIQPEFNTFWDEIRDADYVAIQPLTDIIYPGGEVTGTPPWDTEDELQYGNSYSIEIFGEFWSKPETAELIQIGEVDIWPYRLGEQPPPW